ncbi:MAG: CDP-alcohol phosphatidyltransferase family protein [Caulobacterales bacterium]|nr:CDP-alcohol phosphatidyltransferase family protein [Caulobacterales bacterium]
MSETPENRRPLKTRSKAWAGALAAELGRQRVSPDVISMTSVAFAALGAALLLTAGLEDQPVLRGLMLVMAAVCVQLRLLANMLDGMVAVEHGLGSSAGPIWNELPDRIADALVLVGAGYAAWGMGMTAGSWLGLLAALLAVLTAYVRELGRGLDFPADFSGPMAKPHRMFALTVTCVLSALEPLWRGEGQVLMLGLGVIAAGTAWTVVRRTGTLAKRLAERDQNPSK